jgi:hypothetical protein
MSFKSVWGFDPDEVARAQDKLRSKSDDLETSYGPVEQQAARIPTEVDAQIYELRRIFRLQKRS